VPPVSNAALLSPTHISAENTRNRVGRVANCATFYEENDVRVA